MKRLKIATWNIGSMPEKAENEAAVLSVAADLNADVLCLQEFPEDEGLIRKLTEAGGFTYSKILMTSRSHVGRPHRMGIAVFSRLRPEKVITHPLVKPYGSLVSFYGQREELHAKSFMAAAFTGFVLITGHGFPCVRYCSPHFEYRPEMTADWRKWCISGEDYSCAYEDLDRWAEEVRRSYAPLPVFFAADFNVDRQLDYLPESRKHFTDVFEGEITRPPQYNIGRYKTDAVLCPKNWTILARENIDGILDHHLLSVTIEI